LDDEEEFDDKEDNGSLYEIIDGDGKVEEPTSESKFSSLEEVISYYRKYAKQIGFVVIRRGIKKKGNRDVYIILACIREGKQRKSKSDAKKAIPKIRLVLLRLNVKEDQS
jgi:hypothetical protein